ncbi:outer membrane protein-like protein iml2 [Amylocarpus encephaloides]|uniref:Inclusion body clearance protein IML2 n=1 Tax=Amylocarpus encephaloides TaxID=45428 RepID=A0A9P7YA58_9HELO|nr:outer membrane protein-like protein iml2 [Amylocarpus encephaloides]
MASWFKSAVKGGQEKNLAAEDEDRHLLHVESALLQLLNDDIAAADKILKEHESSYHFLGRGISSFITSMLGAEKELLKDASNKLLAAESKNWEDMKKAQKEPTAFRSHIYPPGTEYLLCYAVSQLTSAICGVMSGSVTQAVRGFYKLRQAFVTLDGIMQVEAKYLQGRFGNASGVSLSQTNNGNVVRMSHDQGPTDEKNDERMSSSTSPRSSLEDFEIVEGDMIPLSNATMVHSRLLEISPASVGITSHTDIFIHSGTRLCYGMLLVIFSMIENPLFTKILYIVGFKGDRERGTRYLWEAARFDNFNSAIAGIALLGYYNGLSGFSDILPTDASADNDLSGYPRGRCRKLLLDMRKRYPDSKLWKMEEARMQGFDRNLAAAMEILCHNADSNMKQIAAINQFEMSFTAMFLHDYKHSAKCWQRCAELSQWSPALYAFLTGLSHLELYRDCRLSDPEKAKKQKKLSEEYIRKAPPMTGKQKVMAKELPFDLFITRKVGKWEERAKLWEVDLADAIGVSPITEMIYLWNGVRKQNATLLEKSLANIQWDRTSHPNKFEDDLDEKAVKALLESCMLRNLGKYDEARALLNEGILRYDRALFRGKHTDEYTPASAHYEVACIEWAEKDLPSSTPELHKAKVLSCEEELQKTTTFHQYVLDGRLSMKVTTGLVTIKRHKEIMGY